MKPPLKNSKFAFMNLENACILAKWTKPGPLVKEPMLSDF